MTFRTSYPSPAYKQYYEKIRGSFELFFEHRGDLDIRLNKITQRYDSLVVDFIVPAQNHIVSTYIWVKQGFFPAYRARLNFECNMIGFERIDFINSEGKILYKFLNNIRYGTPCLSKSGLSFYEVNSTETEQVLDKMLTFCLLFFNENFNSDYGGTTNPDLRNWFHKQDLDHTSLITPILLKEICKKGPLDWDTAPTTKRQIALYEPTLEEVLKVIDK